MMRLVIVGGSDAGISAALRARELDHTARVELLLADRWPNYSICGLPYLLSGEVNRTDDLAHRTRAQIEDAGVAIHTDHRVVDIDPDRRVAVAQTPAGTRDAFEYDALIIATGARPQRPPISDLDLHGVHMLHTVDDALSLAESLIEPQTRRAVIVGAGYIGLEMSEALRHRDLDVTLIERLPEVMPTVDAEIGALVHTTLQDNGVRVLTDDSVLAITRTADGLTVRTASSVIPADVVLVVSGVEPDAELGTRLGIVTGARGALAVDDHMNTDIDGIWAAGDCVHTHHRLLEQPAYFPLGTTAHKQGRVAGENAIGGDRRFAGVLGTQVVKVFDHAIASTGLREDTAPTNLYTARTEQLTAPDHKRYYPGAIDLTIRICGDDRTGRLLGAQIIGGLTSQVAKRIDVFAAALHHQMTVDSLSELDLSYTPPFGAPWDAIQEAAQQWVSAADGAACAKAP